MSCPREIVSYSRKIRCLDEQSQFKANEYFNWLFYISPIVFLNRISTELYAHLSNLVFGIRLLLESSSEFSLTASKKFIDDYCKEVVTVHAGNQRAETINIHCSRHLTDQVRRFGPLFCQSAMSFEAANRSIGEIFSGSNSELEVICRRILQRHHLSEVDFQSEKIKPLICKLSGKNQSDKFLKMNLWRPKRYRTLVFNIWAALLKTVVTLRAATLTRQHINAQKWATVMFFSKKQNKRNLAKFSTSFGSLVRRISMLLLQMFGIFHSFRIWDK